MADSIEMARNVGGYNNQDEAYIRVVAFLHQLWEHPLLDDKTRDHRQSALDAINRSRLKYNRMVALLAGSSLWKTDDLSDYDFVAVLNSIEQLISFHDERDDNLKLHCAAATCIADCNRFKPWGHIFLTPDEYVAGDKQLCHAMRLKLADLVMLGDVFPRYSYQGIVDHFEGFFNHNFRNWRFIPGKRRPPLTELLYGNRSRNARFNQALKNRSNQFCSPELWREQFVEVLDRFELPSLDVFVSAIYANKGALQISDYSYRN